MNECEAVFLIAAHHHPQHLARLIARLRADWTRILVHVDRKADRNAFEQAVGDRSLFLEPRWCRSVHWAGFSQVEATMTLLEAALAKEPAARAFCLLSGVDYPVKPLLAIRDALAGGRQFMTIDRAVAGHGDTVQDHFVQDSYFGDTRWLNERSSPVLPLARFAKRLGRFWPKPSMPGAACFHGCSWWAITRDAAETAIRFFKEPGIRAFFQRTQSADEFFFQTALKHSGLDFHYSDDRTTGQPAEPNVHGMHYIDWTYPAERPKILRMEDVDKIRSSSALFARKFDPARSSDLLDWIDHQLL